MVITVKVTYVASSLNDGRKKILMFFAVLLCHLSSSEKKA